MRGEGKVNMSGDLQLKHRKGGAKRKAPLTWKVRNWLRWSFISATVMQWLAKTLPLGRLGGVLVATGELELKHRKPNGVVTDYGVVGRRSVTTVFVEDLTDELQASQANFSTYRFHAYGTSATAENVADVGLGKPIDNTTVEVFTSGTQEENASNIYQSSATVTFANTNAVVEHALADTSLPGFTLMDRTVFSAVNVDPDDSITGTFRLTVNSGG